MTHPTRDGAPSPPATRPDTVLVLGGGGLKGIAHIGALRALDEAGVRPDAIVGTSIGALVGALAAAGVSADALADRARALEKDDILHLNRWVAWIRGLKQRSVYVGDRLKEYIRDALPVERFEDLSVPFRLNTVSLNTGRPVWFGTGARTDLPLADAVYASSALPVYFPPLSADGDFLVDGGMLDPLPIRAALDWAADRVIAVDVSADFEAASAEPWIEHGIVGIHQRVMEVNAEKARRMIPSPDMSRVLLVRPEIGHLGTFEFGHAEFAMERGYAAMVNSLEEMEAATAAADGRVRDLWMRVKRVVRGVVPVGSGRASATTDGRADGAGDGGQPRGRDDGDSTSASDSASRNAAGNAAAPREEFATAGNAEGADDREP